MKMLIISESVAKAIYINCPEKEVFVLKGGSERLVEDMHDFNGKNHFGIEGDVVSKKTIMGVLS